MQNINSVVLEGNVVHDIGEKDFGYVGSENGVAKLTVTIAVNRNVKKNGEWVDEPSFFDVVMWGKPAENLKPYLVKGKGLIVQGSLIQDRWEKDGQKKSRIYVNADVVRLSGGGKEKSEQTESAKPKGNNDGFPEDIEF